LLDASDHLVGASFKFFVRQVSLCPVIELVECGALAKLRKLPSYVLVEADIDVDGLFYVCHDTIYVK
jgi:hypothetical protein